MFLFGQDRTFSFNCFLRTAGVDVGNDLWYNIYYTVSAADIKALLICVGVIIALSSVLYVSLLHFPPQWRRWLNLSLEVSRCCLAKTTTTRFQCVSHKRLLSAVFSKLVWIQWDLFCVVEGINNSKRLKFNILMQIEIYMVQYDKMENISHLSWAGQYIAIISLSWCEFILCLRF